MASPGQQCAPAAAQRRREKQPENPSNNSSSNKNSSSKSSKRNCSNNNSSSKSRNNNSSICNNHTENFSSNNTRNNNSNNNSTIKRRSSNSNNIIRDCSSNSSSRNCSRDNSCSSDCSSKNSGSNNISRNCNSNCSLNNSSNTISKNKSSNRNNNKSCNSSSNSNHSTNNSSNKLISTATLTLLILLLSSGIAYATAAIAQSTPPTSTRSSSDLGEDNNNSSSSNAFLGAIAAVNSSPIAIVSQQFITSSPPNGSSSSSGGRSGTVLSMSDMPLLLEDLPPGGEDEQEEFELPPLQSVIVSIILLIVILGTVVGNVLVCIAVCMVRKLRRPCNYLLVSLALSDLCVALLVMPMALLAEVLERWNFGTVLCDIWVSFDVLCCTASILNLCAISVDRYLAITKPLEYGVKRTPRRMMLCVGIVWLAAACISLPPLLILGNEHEDEDGQPICTVCQNFAYQIYATLGSFYIPLSVMLFVYYQIFKAARRIVLEEKRAQTHLQQALNGTGSPQTATAPTLGHTELGNSGNGAGAGHGHRHSSVGNTSLTYSTCGGLSTSGGAPTSGVGIPHGHHGSGSTGLLGSPHHKKLRFQLAKEKKASTTLGIIMSAFTICWLPFFILALIRPFETMHVPPSLSSLFLWLGYANSLLNPIIYATLNRDFRKPFQEILYFRCSSLNTMMRENYYQDQYGEPPSQRVMLGDERHGARESFL